MKFVHAADLHIDSPLVGLARYEGAPVERIRSATRRATENLVSLCIDERVDLLLLAGDLFDGDWKDYSTGLFFSAQMARLAHAKVPVVLVRGNHDAASQITRQLRLPSNVVELSSQGAETRVFEELKVAVHGQSYQHRAETADLASEYPYALPGYFNIGLLHTAATGRAGHESYAPCIIETLRSKGYQYWALGHVHRREVLSEAPWIVFSGNLQGRHAKETGPKGASLVQVEGGVVSSVEHRALDVVRFAVCEVSIGSGSAEASAVTATIEEDAEPEQIVDHWVQRVESELTAAEGRTLVVRGVISGTGPAHTAFRQEPERWENELRARVTELGDVWLERMVFATSPKVSIEQLAERVDAVGQVLRAVQRAKNDEAELHTLNRLFADLFAKLPLEVRQTGDGPALDDLESLKQALDDVEQELAVALTEEASE